MSWFSSESPHNNLQVLWRIDSAGIAVSVLSELGKVAYYDFQPIIFFTLDDRHHYDQLLHHTQVCMNRMIPNLLHHLQAHPHRATIILGEPWAHSIRRHIIYKRKTPFKLTHAFVDDLITRDMKKLIQEYRHDAVDFIDPTYHQLSIGGHTVSDPWGKSVNDIRFDYVTGFSDEQMVDMVTAIIHEKLKVPLLQITIDHYQNSLIRFWSRANIASGLLIDISGFVTDLYIFPHKQLMQSGTLPMGISSMRQKIAGELGIYPDELHALLGLYQKNLMDDVMMKRVGQLLGNAFVQWENDFQKFCNQAVNHGDVISQVIWVGNADDPILQFFMHTLQNDGLKFPIIFGTNQVGFLHSNAIIDTLGVDDYSRNLQNQDRIILAGLVS